MTKKLQLILILLLSINSYSQISFEKGYYIDNSNQKVECLIKNIDWKNSPTKFEYKRTAISENETENIKTVKEFGIYNISKYVRDTVEIDKSGNNINNLSNVIEPEFEVKELFLKVLIEGKASLYVYEGGNYKKFFYNTADSKIEQLIFKEYLINHKIGKNNKFRQQLWNNLKCSTFSINKATNLGYNKAELINYFVDYNKCNNEEYTNFEKKQKKDLFNLNIRPGLNNSSLAIENKYGIIRKSPDFDSKLRFRLGLEAEFILGFNKNKWAFIIEPTYQYFKSEKKLYATNVKVDYKSIELPIGIRHYLFLNKDAKLFINGSLVLDFNKNSTIDYDNSIIDYDNSIDLGFNSKNNIALGIGYKHKDRYSLELRYFTKRSILKYYPLWKSEYKTLSVILGYSFF